MYSVTENVSSLKDRIYHYVVVNVQDGVFAPNSKLSEESIASALEVSRTPVREVLTQLASEGYIHKIPRRGFFVREWTKEEKIQTYEVISHLDFLCAKKAIPYLDEKDITLMREYIAKMDVAINFKNYQDYVKNQSQFHYVYIKKCQNDILIHSIETLIYRPMPVTYSSNKQSDEFFNLFKKNNQEHRTILECMINKDLAKLEEIITIHWNEYTDDYL